MSYDDDDDDDDDDDYDDGPAGSASSDGYFVEMPLPGTSHPVVTDGSGAHMHGQPDVTGSALSSASGAQQHQPVGAGRTRSSVTKCIIVPYPQAI